METNSILTANILDIIFEGRNKNYGAYELRKHYEQRVGSSLGITAIVILIFAIAVLSFQVKPTDKIITNIKDVELSKEQIHEIVIPRTVTPKSLQARASEEHPPLILKEIELPKTLSEPVPADIITGIESSPGTQDIGMNPLETKNFSAIEVPAKKVIESDQPFTKVEIEARFNGNWNAYVKNEIEKNMEELVEAGVSGTCIIKFIVSVDGTVSDVEALTMQGTKLAEICVNAIRKGPKWIPAQQNNQVVKAYRQQPVKFTIND